MPALSLTPTIVRAAPRCVPAHSLWEQVSLYFSFLKQLAMCFFVMTLLALPVMLINFSGGRISEENRDALSVSVTSLGNNGLSADDEARRMHDCVSSGARNCNVTMIGAWLVVVVRW